MSNVHNRNDIFSKYISNLKVDFFLLDHGLVNNWERDEHIRKRDSIYLILDGEGSITINGSTIYPKKNSMVLIPKNSRMSYCSKGDKRYNKYWCDFIMHFDGISLFDVISFPYVIELSDIKPALELFERLDELHCETDARSALLIKAALLELVALFLDNDRSGTAHTVKDNPFISRVRQAINDSLTQKLTVKKLADTFGFSEKYFISIFKRNFKDTPAHYIKVMRLERVKHELLYSDKPILHISERLGFSSAQRLSKDFKDYTGFTPSEFRRLFK